jgi:hypothetical protein
MGGTSLFAIDGKGDLFRSVNADSNWTKLSVKIGKHPVTAFIVDGTDIYAGTDSGVYRSANNGTDWMSYSNELTPYPIRSLVAIPNLSGGTNIIASTPRNIFLSTNHGENWTVVNTTAVYEYHGLVAGHNAKGEIYLFAITQSYDIVCSADNGATWTALNPLDPYSDRDVNCLAVHDTIMYAGTYDHGVFFTCNRGATWVQGGGDGMWQRPVHALVVSGAYLFAGVASDIGPSKNSVWRRPLSEMLTEVKDRNKQDPSVFSLDQNYPNPFNPSTMIGFHLAKSGLVVLKVYDVLGRDIQTLVNERKAPGAYQVEWKTTSVPTGVYFYRITSGAFTQTRRMVVQK